MKYTSLKVTTPEKIAIIAALHLMGRDSGRDPSQPLSDAIWLHGLANRIADSDPANDGVEVDILRDYDAEGIFPQEAVDRFNRLMEHQLLGATK